MSEFIPKVGEECKLLLDGGIYEKVIYHGKSTKGYDIVEFMDGGVHNLGKIESYQPIKTPAEIEREGLISELYSDLIEIDIYDNLINLGYRKQQVKPLSFDDYYLIGSTNSLQQSYRKLTECGFVIQGGDK